MTPEEQTLLDRLCEAYYLPAWCSLADYERLFAAHGIRGGWCCETGLHEGGAAATTREGSEPCRAWRQDLFCPPLVAHPTHPRADVKTADWSVEVQPFWGQVIKSALTTQGVTGLLKAGWTTIKVRDWSRGLRLAVAGAAGHIVHHITRRTPLMSPLAHDQGALVMPLMARGLSMGLIKFVLITGVKAET